MRGVFLAHVNRKVDDTKHDKLNKLITRCVYEEANDVAVFLRQSHTKRSLS